MQICVILWIAALLICLPIKIADSDGAPARAIIRKMDEDDNA